MVPFDPGGLPTDRGQCWKGFSFVAVNAALIGSSGAWAIVPDSLAYCSRLVGWPAARAHHRSPVGVKPVTTPCRALHLEDGLET